MKRILFFGLILSFSQISIAQTLENDRLALIALYNSTNGAGWTNSTGWNVPGTVGDNPCGWYGVDCQAVAGMQRVIVLDLRTNNLSGTIPAQLGNMDQLFSLILERNQLTGTIPTSLGNLTLLGGLILRYNMLTGTIPSSLGNLTALAFLEFGNNQLTGTIPSSFFYLSNLQILAMEGNQLSGTVPPFYLYSSSLTALKIENNAFTFDGMEGNMAILTRPIGPFYTYYPQELIPIYQSGNTLSINPGGTISGETIRWYDATTNALVATVSGNTSWTPTMSGTYYAVAFNPLVPKLFLRSKNAAIALPVRWLSTTASLNADKTVSVNWETADEVQNKGFEVERSSNGKGFERINTSPPAPEGGASTKRYEFIDIQPLLGISYYRIKQLDIDGGFSYSRMVSVINDTGIAAFPNPTTDQLTITMPQGLTGSAQLTDINGRAIRQVSLLQIQQTLKLDNTATGTYFLTIYDDNLKVLKAQKIVKQ